MQHEWWEEEYMQDAMKTYERVDYRYAIFFLPWLQLEVNGQLQWERLKERDYQENQDLGGEQYHN